MAIKKDTDKVIEEKNGMNVTDNMNGDVMADEKLEAGINNIFDEIYFTRRATGYPGPGIIPSPPRNTYLTLQIIL